jgi:hypothetical protein
MDTSHTTPTLGIDIGRVIIGPVDDDGKADTSFLSGTLDQALETLPAPGAFDSIARLADRFGGAVWLVSKCGPRVQEKTRRWLERWRFWDVTGVPAGHLRFCLERPQKAQHCLELGITHFIDDRLDVLEHLRAFVPWLYLFGAERRRSPPPDWVIPVITWPETLAAVLRETGGTAEAPSP